MLREKDAKINELMEDLGSTTLLLTAAQAELAGAGGQRKRLAELEDELKDVAGREKAAAEIIANQAKSLEDLGGKYREAAVARQKIYNQVRGRPRWQHGLGEERWWPLGADSICWLLLLGVPQAWATTGWLMQSAGGPDPQPPLAFTPLQQLEDMKGKIRVYCRVRPVLPKEEKAGKKFAVALPDEFSITLLDKTKKEFTFNAVFQPGTSQERVFEDTKHLIQSAVDGYNVCIFAYGQSGSGKTFTIYGNETQPGLTPRGITELFRILDKDSNKFSFKVEVTLLQLYVDDLQVRSRLGRCTAKLSDAKG